MKERVESEKESVLVCACCGNSQSSNTSESDTLDTSGLIVTPIAEEGSNKKLQKCGKCDEQGITVLYCSRECQVEDFKSHKKACGGVKTPIRIVSLSSKETEKQSLIQILKEIVKTSSLKIYLINFSEEEELEQATMHEISPDEQLSDPSPSLPTTDSPPPPDEEQGAKPFSQRSYLLGIHVNILNAYRDNPSMARNGEIASFLYFPSPHSYPIINKETGEQTWPETDPLIPVSFHVSLTPIVDLLWNRALYNDDMLSLLMFYRLLKPIILRIGGTEERLQEQLNTEFGIDLLALGGMFHRQEMEDHEGFGERMKVAFGGNDTFVQWAKVIFGTANRSSYAPPPFKAHSDPTPIVLESKTNGETKSAKKRKKIKTKKEKLKQALPSVQLLSHLSHLTFLRHHSFGHPAPSFIFFPTTSSYPHPIPTTPPSLTSPPIKSKKKSRQRTPSEPPLPIPIFVDEDAQPLFTTLFLTALRTSNPLTVSLIYFFLLPYIVEAGGSESRLMEQLNEEFKVDLEEVWGGRGGIGGDEEDWSGWDLGDAIEEEKLLEIFGGQVGLSLFAKWQEEGGEKEHEKDRDRSKLKAMGWKME